MLDCMIVGGHKCGTTSLKEYLGAHPDVVTHPQTEFTALTEGDSAAAQLGNLADDAEGRLTMAKNAGAYADTLVLDRLKEVNPGCRVLLILRDPVARALSAFRMEALWGEVQRPFGEEIVHVLAEERQGRGDWRARVYLQMGLYGRWLEEVQSRFPEDNVKVLFLEELEGDTAPAYRDTCEWLGLSTDFSPDLETRYNVGADPKSMLLARTLNRLRSERNPLKRAARQILPEASYLRLAGMARDANATTKRVTRSTGDDGVKTVDAQLREYFETDEEELRSRLARELPWRQARSDP